MFLSLRKLFINLFFNSLIYLFICYCSVTKACPTLWKPMDCSTLDCPVLHCLLEFAQIYVHWVGDAIQPSLLHHPLLLLPLVFPSIRVFPMSRLFTWNGESIGVSASVSVLLMNIHSWFPLGFMGLIFLLFKGFSRVFSSTTVQKHQFFGSQPSLWSNYHIHICDYWKNYSFDYMDHGRQSDVSPF